MLEELRRSIASPGLATGALSGDVASRLAEELSGLPAIARVTSWYTLPPFGGLDPATLHALLVPLDLHASFAADTFVRLEAEASATRRAALSTALRLRPLSATSTPTRSCPLPPPTDPAQPRTSRTPSGRLDEKSCWPGPMRSRPSMRPLRVVPLLTTWRSGGEILRLIGLVNAAARAAGRPEIFPPTSRLYAECPVVCLTFARTVADVARVVNALFLLLYEGGGAKSLRLLTPNGGPLSSPSNATPSGG